MAVFLLFISTDSSSSYINLLTQMKTTLALTSMSCIPKSHEIREGSLTRDKANLVFLDGSGRLFCQHIAQKER